MSLSLAENRTDAGIVESTAAIVSPVTDLIITGESEALALLPQLILAASDKVTEDDQRDDACPDDGSESEGSLQGDDDDLEGFDIDAVFAKMGLESRAPADRTTVTKKANAPPRPTNTQRSSSDTNLKKSKEKKASKRNSAPPATTVSAEHLQRKE